MRLSAVFTASAVIISVSGILAAGVLVFSTSRLREQTEQLAGDSASIRAAEALELSLLIHDREWRLFESTGARTHADAMTTSRAMAIRWLDGARTRVTTEEERRLLGSLEREIDAYFKAVDGKATSDDARNLIADAVRSASKLVDINVRDADIALQTAKRINQRAIVVAMTTAAVLMLSAIGALLLLRRTVYVPIMKLSGALRTFGAHGGGEPLRIRGVQELRDVAEEYNRMVDELRAAEERQVRFLAGVAHDLRNPLGALKLTSTALARGRDVEKDEKLVKGLQRIGSQVESLDRMVGDLLDRTRIEAGVLELRTGRCDLWTIAEEVVELHRAVTTGHELTLESSEPSVPIECDRVRIIQVLTNLVSNAIKYSPEGGAVRVRVGIDGNDAFAEVRDEGLGIAPEELPRIFDPFHRAKGAARNIPGVGLGLSVSRRIVEAHRGRIDVESELGKGSTFRMRLPLARD